MSRQFKSTSKTLPRIKVTSRTFPQLQPQEVGEALGAGSKSKVNINAEQSPLSLMRVRQELYERLSSTGGRPGLKDAARRQKIPLQESDWERLQELAQLLADDGVLRPTPGQVASVLLRQILEKVDVEELKSQLKRDSET